MKGVPRYITDLWVAHEAFRRLGFDAEDLYVGHEDVLNVGPNTLYLALRTQGKQFTFTIARVDVNRELVFQQWQDFSSKITEHDEEELLRIWSQSQIGGNLSFFLALVGTLAKRGFTMPEVPGAQADVAAQIFGQEMVFPRAKGEA